jgi:hypothetical protein
MSKSTLSIAIPGNITKPWLSARTVEVPCRLPESFNFKFAGKTYTADLLDLALVTVEPDGNEEPCTDEYNEAGATAEAILANVKTHLMILGAPVLCAIALAYEAETAAYDAAVRALAALPRVLHSLALLPTHPAENDYSPAVLMLRKYVEHVVEQACKAQTERTEAQAKVAP